MYAGPDDCVVRVIWFNVWHTANVRPRESARVASDSAFPFGFQPFGEPVCVGEGAFAFAFVCKVAHTLVGVCATFVAPNPRLVGVARNSNVVVGCVFGWDMIVVIPSLPPASVVYVDGVEWCIRRVGNGERLVNSCWAYVTSLA